jgi:hypothetical protein
VVCHKSLDRCGHAPGVRESQGERKYTARHGRPLVHAFLAEYRDTRQRSHNLRALSCAWRSLAARGAGQRVFVPSYQL